MLGRMSDGGLQRMSDEELARMDRLTREAIDERLRVLESVSQTVYGCVDELMRLRSSLPERATPPPQGQEGDANQAGGSGSTGS